jgi:hypothetical protein
MYQGVLARALIFRFMMALECNIGEVEKAMIKGAALRANTFSPLDQMKMQIGRC